MMRLRRSALLCLSWAIAFLAMVSLCPATIQAQEGEEDTFMLEDVVVTAERRETELQETQKSILILHQTQLAL